MSSGNSDIKTNRKMATDDKEDTKEIIASLARQFYDSGWFPGSGGSLTIRASPDRIFIAPSGVQKERIKANDIFILDRNAEVIERPPQERNLRPSQCTPLFMVAYNERPEVGAVIHSHDPNVVLASMLYKGNEFKIRDQHMIKGIFNFVEGRPGYFDEELIVPIVENRREDYLLCDTVAKAIREYPQCNAVILRYHGIHIFGKDWVQCKLMAESYHYLAKMAVEMHKCGINPYTTTT